MHDDIQNFFAHFEGVSLQRDERTEILVKLQQHVYANPRPQAHADEAMTGSERVEGLQRIHQFMREQSSTEPSALKHQAPLFFGQWSGLHPFRGLKPFFHTPRVKAVPSYP